MNKWRLLLLSVLGLLQSASTESNFVDGRIRYRTSGTRLSNYRVYKTLPESRPSVRQDLQYPVIGVEFTGSSAIRHHNRRSPIVQDNKFVLADHQRTFDTERFRVYNQNDKHLFRDKTYDYNSGVPLNILENGLTQNNRRHRYKYVGTGSSFRITKKDNAATKNVIHSAEDRKQDEASLNKSERTFSDRKMINRMKQDHVVHDRQAYFSSPESANDFNKKVTNGDTLRRKFRLINENGQERDATQTSSYGAHARRHENRLTARNIIRKDVVGLNDMIRNNNKENIIRRKRSIETRIRSCMKSSFSEETHNKKYNARSAINIRPENLLTRNTTVNLTREKYHNEISKANTQDIRQDILRRLSTVERQINHNRYTNIIREKRVRDTRRRGFSNKGIEEVFLHLNTRSTENIRDDKSQISFSSKKTSNMFPRVVHSRGNENHLSKRREMPWFKEGQRRTIIGFAEKREDIQQDRSRRLSNVKRATHEILHSRNIQERLRNTQRITNLAREQQHSISKLNNFIQQSRSLALFNGERVTNELNDRRNIQTRHLNTRRITTTSIREKRSISELPETNVENILNTRRVSSQRFSNRERITNVFRHNRNIREERLLNRRFIAHLREQYSISESHKRHIENNKHIRQSSNRCLSSEERLINKLQESQNMQEIFLNTRHVRIPLIRQNPSSSKLTETYKENTKNLDPHNSIRQRVTNEIRYYRNTQEKLMNKQYLTTLVRDQDSKLHTDNTASIRQVRSPSFSTGERVNNKIKDYRNTQQRQLNTENSKNNHRAVTQRFSNGDTNKIRQNLNIRDERLQNTRYISPLIREQYSISDLKNRYTKNNERVINKVQDKRNNREEYMNTWHMRLSLRERRYMIFRSSGRYTEKAQGICQHRSHTASPEERTIHDMHEIRTINERSITLSARENRYLTSKLPERYIENTQDIRQARSIRQKTNNEIRDSQNIRRERLLNMRRTSILTAERQHAIYKFSRKFIESTKDLRQDISKSSTIQARVISFVRQDTRNPYLSDERISNEIEDTKRTDRRFNKERVTPIKNTQHSTSTNLRSSLQLKKKSTDNNNDIRTDKPRLSRRMIVEFRVTQDIRKRVTNTRRKSALLRERQYSTVHRSVNPSTTINFDKMEGTSLVSWQYLFYLLQAIYLYILCLKIPQDNGDLKKKTRFADWFPGMDYLKID